MTDLEQALSQSRHWQQQHAQAISYNVDLLVTIDGLKVEIAQLREQVGAVPLDESREAGIEGLQSIVREMAAQSKGKDDEINRLCGIGAVQRDKLDKQSMEIDDLKADNKLLIDCGAEETSLKAEIERLKGVVAEGPEVLRLQEDNGKLQGHLIASARECKELEAKNAEQLKDMHTRGIVIRERDKTIKELNADILIKHNKIEARDAEIKTIKEDREQLRRQYFNEQFANRDNDKNLKWMQEQIDMLQVKLAKLQSAAPITQEPFVAGPIKPSDEMQAEWDKANKPEEVWDETQNKLICKT